MPADPVVKPLARLSLRQPGFWMFPAVLTFVAVAAELFGEPARLALRYERDAIGDGQLWRLLCGHLVHLGPQHLLLNLLGLTLVWVLVGSYLRSSRWFLALGVIVAGMDFGFWVLRPTLDWYVGLSGVLHGLLATGLVAGWRHAPVESAVLALLVTAKLAWEQLGGALPGSEAAAGGPVVVDAHLYGAVAGILAGVLLTIMTRRRGPI